MTEEKLLLRLRKGKTDALEVLIDRYNGYVASIITFILGSSGTRQDVEELVSDVFLAVWNHADAITVGKIKPYIAATARNRARSFLRGIRELPMELDEVILPIADNTQNALLEKEQHRLIRQAILEMPTPDKEIFLRYYYYFQSSGDIAQQMNLSPGTVRTHLMRGRNKLKEKFLQEEVL